MHGHRHGRRFRRRFPNRQDLLARLQEHQRDLEQELADVADLIRHLQDDSETAPQGQPQTA